jgi:hypothetical protein
MMESRRVTMSNPSAAFSNIAQEALDHIVADTENDEYINQEGGHIFTHQRSSRRRLRVS